MPSDWYLLNPTCDHNCPRLFELCDEFLENNPIFNQCYLFYVYGHANELDVDNRWERIEEFFKKVSNHDDVWYATNVEIYDYINAFKQLEMSVDSKYLYNPTVTTLSLYEGTAVITVTHPKVVYPTEILVKVLSEDSISEESSESD